MENFKIGENGLTLEAIENRIIDIFEGRETPDSPDTLNALKKARMEYLDASESVNGYLTEEYQKKALMFNQRDHLEDYLEKEVRNYLAYPPEKRPKTFIGTELLEFRSDETLDPKQMCLRKALLGDSDYFKVSENFKLGSIDYSTLARTGRFLHGTPISLNGIPKRFLPLKQTHHLSDFDIVSLKRVKVTVIPE